MTPTAQADEAKGMTDERDAYDPRSYAKGYAAGRKRQKVDVSAEREVRALERRRQAFMERSFPAVLQSLMASNWGRPVNGKHQVFRTTEEWSEATWKFLSTAWERRL
jgi:hypothetical protein